MNQLSNTKDTGKSLSEAKNYERCCQRISNEAIYLKSQNVRHFSGISELHEIETAAGIMSSEV